MNDFFLMSREWRSVRMMALERDGAKCACCGRRTGDGLVMNVDHIKPRTRHPELALTLSNLQVLCNECNQGKGNRYETDWRESGCSSMYFVGGDPDGRKRAWAKLESLLPVITDQDDPAFVFLPDGVSGDEFLAGDPAAIARAETSAVNWREFLLAELGARGPDFFKDTAVSYLQRVNSPLHQDKLRRRISEITNRLGSK